MIPSSYAYPRLWLLLASAVPCEAFSEAWADRPIKSMFIVDFTIAEGAPLSQCPPYDFGHFKPIVVCYPRVAKPIS